MDEDSYISQYMFKYRCLEPIAKEAWESELKNPDVINDVNEKGAKVIAVPKNKKYFMRKFTNFGASWKNNGENSSRPRKSIQQKSDCTLLCKIPSTIQFSARRPAHCSWRSLQAGLGQRSNMRLRRRRRRSPALRLRYVSQAGRRLRLLTRTSSRRIQPRCLQLVGTFSCNVWSSSGKLASPI